MPDCEKLYLKLFNETTDAIAALQKAQQTAEELYISDGETDSSNVVRLRLADDDEKISPQGECLAGNFFPYGSKKIRSAFRLQSAWR